MRIMMFFRASASASFFFSSSALFTGGYELESRGSWPNGSDFGGTGVVLLGGDVGAGGGRLDGLPLDDLWELCELCERCEP